MASGHIFKLLKEIKDLNLDYEGAVRYLTDKGVEVTGIIKQGLNNFFKKNKARDVDFGSVVKKIPYDDFNVPFNPNNPLKNYSKGKDGVGTLFKNKSKTLADELAQAEGVETFETILPTKKLPDIKMGSRINYEAIADKAGIDVELIRGKNWEEIMEIIKGKADGGRAGFEIGGLSGEAQSIYDAWLSAGHSEEDVLAYLESRGLYSATPENVGIKSIVNTAPPILPQGGDDDGGNIVTRPSYKYTSKLDAPVGSQAWLNDIGEGTIPKEDITLGTQWNELKHQFSRIPTPLSLAKRGIVGAQNWWSNQRAKNTARQEEQRQEEAAKAAALQSLQLSMARDQAIANQQDWTGESDTYTGGMDTSTGNYYDPYDPGETEAEGGIVGYKSYKDGGLATMFARRR